MASDSDASGEELSIIRPGLIREIRNVLDEYPDDGQILKEMIQNAEDAGAKTVKILADNRHFNHTTQPKILKKHPYLAYLKGPALCVYNDAEFTARDWEGIRMIHTSIKEKDPLKVGRFGLGFKSVFHLTDRLAILSGDYILYMDPFKGAESCCKRKQLSKLKTHERESLLQTLNGIFGFNQGTLKKGTFNGTLFWFPLRQEANELSHTIYDEEKLYDLWQAFKIESPVILLFLKRIEAVELYKGSEEARCILEYSVRLAPDCLQSVREGRAGFISGITIAGNLLPEHEVSSCFPVEILMTDHTSVLRPMHQQWMVVNYHAGRVEATEELLELCADDDLAYKPYVGVAAPLGGQQDFQSHLFCFLPLPLDTRSPTGLPVHVNGFFALSQNRRHVKWPTADQQQHQAHMELPLLWNCLLVKQLVPRTYCQLLCRLRENYHQTPDQFYQYWPSFSDVSDKWVPLLHPLYHELSKQSLFYSKANGGQWVTLNEATLCMLPEDTPPDIVNAVEKIYSLCNEKLLILPLSIIKGLENAECLISANISTPKKISCRVKIVQSLLEPIVKECILTYLCDQDDLDLLDGLELLPLANGEVGTFGSDSQLVLYCHESELTLFPGLENLFCSCKLPQNLRNQLDCIAKSGKFSFRFLQKTDIPRLVKQTLQSKFGANECLLPNTDSWLENVWNYLHSNFPEGLHDFLDLPLLPLRHGTHGDFILRPLKGIYICAEVDGMEQMSTGLRNCLTKLSITVFQDLPFYITMHRGILGGLVQFPSEQGIVTVLQLLKQSPSGTAGISSFNRDISVEDREHLLAFLNTCKRDADLDILKEFLWQLQIFSSTRDDIVLSLAQSNLLAPDPIPPVPMPDVMILGKDPKQRNLALRLGARNKDINELCQEILFLMQPERKEYSLIQIRQFMQFLLSTPLLLRYSSMLELAKSVQFIPTVSGQVKSVNGIYDPGIKILQEIFLDGDMFPDNNFMPLEKLKLLNLRDENQVSSSDLLNIAYEIDTTYTKSESIRKSKALWHILSTNIHKYDNSFFTNVSTCRCFPCLVDNNKPQSYPRSLPLLHKTPILVKPCEVYGFEHILLVGSVKPIASNEIKLGSKLDFLQPTWDTVVQQLEAVVSHYTVDENLQYRSILEAVYKYQSKNASSEELCSALQQMRCILVEADATFHRPDMFWIQSRTQDIGLVPYRYLMARDTGHWQELFLACGSHLHQDAYMLQCVLIEIQKKYANKAFPTQADRDLRLVLHILETLKSEPNLNKEELILPVLHSDKSALHFRLARECTVCTEDWLNETLGDGCDPHGDVVFVHPDVPAKTALALGALGMVDRALDGTEEINFDYFQEESLTTRLHNLLKESYTDGFSIPKELLQNADDAGAKVMKFLIDDRLNEDCREHLISTSMASLQGPALWVFNDAKFSDKDFAKIIKIGTGSKKEDASKVGKYGLGFNTVYNLTDAPSFISRHSLAMFDPHKKYLRGKSGMKIDFRSSENRSLLRKMVFQFKPFQGVFECNLQPSHFREYEGTLFRFPFRTDEQAETSEIKGESYPLKKRIEFVKFLIERVGNLLTFTQNVQRIEVFHLPKGSPDPTKAICVMSCTKESHRNVVRSGLPMNETKSILSFCSLQCKNASECGQEPPDICIAEDVTVTIEVTPDAHFCGVEHFKSKIEWLICWATGTGQAADVARQRLEDNFIPLASVAVPLKDHISILPINCCPNGFYNRGRLFCFLPLPDNVESLNIPVHVNGTFALTSNRRNLFIRTDDDMNSVESEWNIALFTDAVCRAHLSLLQRLQNVVALNTFMNDYFLIWPKKEDSYGFAISFYSKVVNEDWNVLPADRHWVSFRNAKFMEQTFSSAPNGRLAFKILQHFWNEACFLVSIPDFICKGFMELGQAVPFRKKVITELEFYKGIFFPNLMNEYWNSPEGILERDSLILQALMHDMPEIYSLVQAYTCIPCRQTAVLKKPHDLVHPNGDVAKLYFPEESCFPQISANASSAINFCEPKCLERLTQLGMPRDNLDWEGVIERTQSIEGIFTSASDVGIYRAYALIDYLASVDPATNTRRFDEFPDIIKKQLSALKFLPVCVKSKDWPFPWFGDERGQHLASPENLCHYNMKNIAACTKELFDTRKPVHLSHLNVKSEEKSQIKLLDELKMSTKDSDSNSEIVSSVTKHLLIIAKAFQENPLLVENSKINRICRDIYAYLQKSIERDVEGLNTRSIYDQLGQERVIWTGKEFTKPMNLVFDVSVECPPYLQQIKPEYKNRFNGLWKVLGIKEAFNLNDVLNAMDHMKTDIGSRKLVDEEVDRFFIAAQLIYKMCMSQSVQTVNPEHLYLPDRYGTLKPAISLCLDDCEWLRESDSMTFIHPKFSNEVAQALGVQSKRGVSFHSHAKGLPFGQCEKLTNRIKRLLDGYTFDASLFKELIQNADDAGATEIRFIKDFRCLGTKKIPEGWQDFQGPALCVFSDSCFRSEDIAGIQNLGDSTKGDDLARTGMYGVGFNAVYHVTDIPSFWTRKDGMEEVICVFDPCRLIKNVMWSEPGVMFQNMEDFKQDYTDMMEGYLGETFDMATPATMFRLPLRTKHMATKSGIKNKKVTVADITQILHEFQNDAWKCLLFPISVRKIGIYKVDNGGKLIKEYEVETEHEKDILNEKKLFYRRLEKEAMKIKSQELEIDLKNVSPLETSLHFILKDSKGKAEDWITVNRVGFSDASQISPELEKSWREQNFRLLPRGGVAVKLHLDKIPNDPEGTCFELTVPSETPSSARGGQAFCTFPLPIETGLPVHVNGHFALEHESRRSLLERDNDERTEWNRQICLNIILPVYISALQQVKEIWFGNMENRGESQDDLKSKIYKYYQLFPVLLQSSLWGSMVDNFYRQIVDRQHALFPVTRMDTVKVVWTTVWKDKMFTAVFSIPPSCSSQGVQGRKSPSQEGSIKQSSNDENDAYYPELTCTAANKLKVLNMKLVEAPSHVFEAVKKNGNGRMKVLNPMAVINFLKSAKGKSTDTCNLKNLPQQLSDTELDEKGVIQLIQYIIQDPGFNYSMLEGVPLCYVKSGILGYFDKNQVCFVSKYDDLVPNHSNDFLHECLVTFFQNVLHPPSVSHQFGILRPFRLTDFALMLVDTLEETYFRTTKPCPLDSNLLPFHNWLKRAWEFICGDIGCCVTNESLTSALSCIEDWSLLPVTSSNGEEFLYPVKCRYNVLNKMETGPDIQSIITRLPVPLLNKTIINNDFAENLVASVNKPASIVEILASFGEEVQLTPEYAKCVLCYVSKNINKIPNVSILRQVWMFVTMEGKTSCLPLSHSALPLPENVPQMGLDVWCKKTSTILLNQRYLTEELRQVLEIEIPSVFDFWKYLLARLYAFSPTAVIKHMEHIKNNMYKLTEEEKKDLLQTLSWTYFIEVSEGISKKPSDFYSPFNDVFKVMLGEECFPPKPYDTLEWKKFMEETGMVAKVTEACYLRFIKEVEISGSSQISDDIKKKSRILVNHLKSNMNQFKSNFLQKLGEIRFVCPWMMENDEDGKHLAHFCRPRASNRLVSFAESCSREIWMLVWSTAAILDPEAEEIVSKSVRAREYLRFNTLVPKEWHKQHIQNVIHSLEGNFSSNSTLVSQASLFCLEKLFKEIYYFLQYRISTDDLQFLRDLPFILHPATGRLLTSDQVVINLKKTDAIENWLFKAPIRFCNFFHLFRKLGVQEKVQASHYAKILEKMYQSSGRETLQNMADVAKLAVKGVITYIPLYPRDQSLGVTTLYLLDNNMCMRPSNEMIFNDNASYTKRLEQVQDKLHFLIDFQCIDTLRMCSANIEFLPLQFKMQRLSTITKEVLSVSAVKLASKSQRFISILISPEFLSGVARLVFDVRRKMQKEQGDNLIQDIQNSLAKIQIYETNNLETVLVVNNDLIPGSEFQRLAFTEPPVTGYFKVFVKAEASKICLRERIFPEISRVLTQAVGDIKGKESLLELMMDNLDKIEDLLDRKKIARLNITRKCTNFAFIRPGSFVPLNQLCYLDPTFHSFSPGEIVALELYDSIIESEAGSATDGSALTDSATAACVPEESNAPESAQVNEEITEATADSLHVELTNERDDNLHLEMTYKMDDCLNTEMTSEKHQIFIYVKVLELSNSNEKHSSTPYTNMYSIDTGAGRRKVPATDLYKLPCARVKTPTDIGHNATTESPYAPDTSNDLNTIQCDLAAAWGILPERRQCLRILKRLCLQWHPAANIGSNKFCGEVYKLAEKFAAVQTGTPEMSGEPSTSHELCSKGKQDASSAKGDQSLSPFLVRIRQRGIHYINQSTLGAAKTVALTSNPQPGEGRRWIRQAEADLQSACHLRDSGMKYACNWSCFLCHQATEKAIKALLYHTDAENKILTKSRTIQKLAAATGSQPLCSLVAELQRVVERKKRMSDVLLLEAPHLPVELYTMEHVRQACDVTRRVLALSAQLLV